MRRSCLLLAVISACASGKAQNDGDDDGDDVQPIDASQPIDAIDRPHIDATEIHAVDAGDPPPDAEVQPDAEIGCTPVTRQMLANGNLDGTPTGISWVQLPTDPAYPPIRNDLPVTEPTAPNAAWLGGGDNWDSAIYQQFSVPVDATSMQISFQKYLATEETESGYDYLRVQIRNNADNVLETLVEYSPTSTTDDGAWIPVGPLVPVNNYAGQTIRLHFQSHTDVIFNTNFFIDTTSITVVACP
jgi:hypothetical protein